MQPELYHECLDLALKIRGAEHQPILLRLYSIACTLHGLGQYEQAEQSTAEITRKCTTIFGTGHDYSIYLPSADTVELAGDSEVRMAFPVIIRSILQRGKDRYRRMYC